MTRVATPLIIIPVVVVGLGVDVRSAIAAALVTVIATTANSAGAYLRTGCQNIQVAIFAVVAAALGALVGAVLSAHVPLGAIVATFALALSYSAYLHWYEHSRSLDGAATARRTTSVDNPPTQHEVCDPAALRFMFLAGSLSGFVGIGPAAAEIVAREQSTPPPATISGTPGEFIIGVTAAVSAGVYSQHGYMDVDLTTPLTIGVFHGSIIAAALRHYGSASSGAQTAIRVGRGVLRQLPVRQCRLALARHTIQKYKPRPLEKAPR